MRYLLLLLAAITPEEADRFFQAQDWVKSAGAYRELTVRDPAAGIYWFRLGAALQNLKQHAEAVAAFESARERKHLPPALFIRAAVSLQTLDRREQALQWLEAGFQAGVSPGIVAGVAALEPLRSDARYEKLAARFRNRCEQPEYRALDFWIGEWDVEAQGRKVGHNKITRTLNGCALEENWTGGGGSQGRSFTWYDQRSGKWKQTYLDGGGGSQEYAGTARDGGIHLLRDYTAPDGVRHMLRMSFTPLGADKVRQFIEESWDGGKTWASWFDGLYVRAKAP